MATRVESLQRRPGAGERVLRGGGRSIWPFLGPAFIASVAYVDPGNFATNIAGGSKFGFTLVWVIVASNLMAMLIQTLSLRSPASLRAVTLLDRPYRRLVEDLPVRYVGFTVPDELFVGYGFDLQERYRNLPDLHVLQS